MPKGQRNLYKCGECERTIYTEDVDDGIAPARVHCRLTPNCPGAMTSLGYPPQAQRLPYMSPKWEFYRPTPEQVAQLTDARILGHIQNGGLLLRRKTT